MKPIKAIKDPEAFQLLGDETRRKIVFLLRVKEMTVSQIAAELNITPQAVYHHIKKLQKADMVEVAREERIDHLIESYYRATAETFFCSVGKTPRSRELAEDQVRTVLNALKRLGFNLEFDENQISQLINVGSKLDEYKCSEKFEDAIADLNDVDFLTKQTVQEYAEIVSMSDKEFSRQQELKKKFRDLLISLVKK
ncbi:MAG: ArsR family transcriptional regulator [Candidatus Bathyarchaeota archaeon]|nr:ArsR family transcriptional regulator [Candidatus Bathyarchaeota archaeon]MDH5532036.1 ArsR family transcriptional regulator [Candidatus Bathyarchaeota archaeon]MDH5712733.1 ArsR family transcriptional regulator [Candidatus Bathyarchaeota archaeon]